MSELYPLKFEPVLKEKVWGGSNLVAKYHKPGDPSLQYGESWEISAVADNLSVVSNGFLAGNNIEELIEVYMGDLTGDSVFDRFGNEFPLLSKLIEAREDLSIQVHPDDKMARERHNAYGKTEMWYILESEKGSKIFTGFRKPINRETFLDSVSGGDLANLLNIETAETGDVFFTPAGRVHALGPGILLAEIQQTSDVTYRIYDWDRIDHAGMTRELHTDLALDALDFNLYDNYKTLYDDKLNETVKLIENPFFVTNILHLDKGLKKDYSQLDSFVIYIAAEGSFVLKHNGADFPVNLGEAILLPAVLEEVEIHPVKETKILEVYMVL